MTLLLHDTRSAREALFVAPWQPRSELELAGQQLRAIGLFRDALKRRENAATAAARSREAQMDAARALEVLRREHDALVARTHQQLQSAGAPLCATAECRAVLAHRNEWYSNKLARTLEGGGVRVVAQLDNGADAVGVIIAEQPDLVFVGDALPMVPGVDVLAAAREFAPDARICAQVSYRDGLSEFLEAGATTAFTRQVPPQEVGRGVLQLVEVHGHARDPSGFH